MPDNATAGADSVRSASIESWLERLSVAVPENAPELPVFSVKFSVPLFPAATPAPRLPEPLKPVPATVPTWPISTSVSAPRGGVGDAQRLAGAVADMDDAEVHDGAELRHRGGINLALQGDRVAA